MSSSTKMPKVTILMAVHNGLPYLPEAVRSILRQTFKDFEFIVVDDASTDGSNRVLRLVSDSRVRLFTNRNHLGLSGSLNKGFALARGKYIARMDHDDISLPDRLAAQLAFMETHPEIGALGTWARTLGLDREQIWRYPISNAEIKAEMLFNSALVHSSVMLRRGTFEKFNLRYNPRIDRAQDYELWSRAADRLHFGNLAKVYLLYRIHSAQAGRQQTESQQAVADEVRLREMRSLGVHPNPAQRKLHNLAAQWRFPQTRAGLQGLEKWLMILLVANQRSEHYGQAALASVLERRWRVACRLAVDNLGSSSWKIYISPPISRSGSRDFVYRIVFRIKAFRAQMKLMVKQA